MTKKGLVAVEEKYYTSCKQMCVDSITSQKVKSPEMYQKIIDSLNGLSKDEVKQYAITLKMTPAEVKAMNNGTVKALEEVLNTYSEYFLKCTKDAIEKQKAAEEAKYKAEQAEKEANRKKNPVYYIGNGGGGDCFDYLGWDSICHRLVKVFVDWDSGHGNEMLPCWENNDISKMPDSCAEDFKKFSAEYFSKNVSCPSMFFGKFDCKVSIPCKVTTGRKFRGEGNLVGYKQKNFRDWSGYVHTSKTALIEDKDGNVQEAVFERVEISTDTETEIVKRGIMNMTVGQIARTYGTYLWHFGKYKDMAYPSIIEAAFKDYNEE